MTPRRPPKQKPKTPSPWVDWESAFALLLRHETLAALLVDAHGCVLRTNPAADELLGPLAPGDQFPWCPNDEGGRARFMKLAGEGGTTIKLCTRSRTGMGIVITAGVAIVGAEPAPLVLLTVSSWRPTSPTQESGEDVEYDISIRDFGRLKQVVRGATSELRVDGRRCYEAIYHRTTPCPGCVVPTAVLSPTERVVGVVPVPSPQRGMTLLSAWLLDSDTVRVSGRYVSEELVSALVLARIDRLAADTALTAREREVLDLLLLGRAPHEIAKALSVSLSTAKFHQSNVLAKLGAESRLDLLRLLQ